MEKGTGSEPVPEEADERIGGELVLEEAVGDAGALKHPAETPSSDEPRKKRIKTLAGRTDLP